MKVEHAGMQIGSANIVWEEYLAGGTGMRLHVSGLGAGYEHTTYRRQMTITMGRTTQWVGRNTAWLPRCTYREFPRGQHDDGDECRHIPCPQTKRSESDPRQRGAGDVTAAHRPALPDGGEREEESERNEDHGERKADGVQVVVGGNTSGAAADDAIRTPRLVASVIPTAEGIAATHGGPVDGAEAHPAVMAEAVAAFVEGIDGPGCCVARDPGDVAVGYSPVGGDEALLLACGPVCRGGRHGSLLCVSSLTERETKYFRA